MNPGAGEQLEQAQIEIQKFRDDKVWWRVTILNRSQYKSAAALHKKSEY